MLGTVTKPCRTEQVGEREFRIVLTQGLNRQIRRMCRAFDYRVERLQRVRIMSLELGDLPVGAWRELTPVELVTLLAPLELKP
jgi:23S rRNA pseudouridine2604 synthase